MIIRDGTANNLRKAEDIIKVERLFIDERMQEILRRLDQLDRIKSAEEKNRPAPHIAAISSSALGYAFPAWESNPRWGVRLRQPSTPQPA